jgi:hypothetical protein
VKAYPHDHARPRAEIIAGRLERHAKRWTFCGEIARECPEVTRAVLVVEEAPVLDRFGEPMGYAPIRTEIAEMLSDGLIVASGEALPAHVAPEDEMRSFWGLTLTSGLPFDLYIASDENEYGVMCMFAQHYGDQALVNALEESRDKYGVRRNGWHLEVDSPDGTKRIHTPQEDAAVLAVVGSFALAQEAEAMEVSREIVDDL